MSGYLPYATDETFDLFDLGNPYPDQNNLGTDFTRHPQTEAIRRQAWEIVGDTSSSYEAAYDIYLHVRNNFNFGGLNVYFSIDLQILSDFTSTGQYRGNCQTDSTILTAYARALGIPARVIYLEYWHRWESEGNEHWFTEFCVLNGTEYQWIPVDGCKDYYDWFGIDNANTRLTAIYPYSMGWRRISGPTVCANFTGSGAYGPYIEVSYTGENTYTNNA
jgi:transglutaminase-like putative cysteine protease